ncbi:DAK2 domain-containing protein, partial [Georgenia sp.]
MSATTLGTDWALDWMARAATTVAENRIELIELDRAIGDGDHGENLERGFTAVTAKLGDTRPESASEVLRLVATTLMSTVGGAAGPLYGTAFLRGAKATDGELDAAAVAAVLEARPVG